MKSVGVIGSGVMGSGIALLFLQNGFKVTLVDHDPENLHKAATYINYSLDSLVAKSRLDKKKRTGMVLKFSTSPHVAAVQDCDLVIEAVPEKTELKLKIFKELDEMCKTDAILASNTSSISITKIAGATKRPEKVIGLHFMNPAPVMKLVEVVSGMKTAPELVKKMTSLLASIGKQAVHVNDAPGFVTNRLLIPMINEAVYILQEGVAKKEDIDSIARLGFNHPMGPLELADFIGLDVCLDIMERLHEDLGDDKYRPCSMLREMVDAGFLGRKTGQGFYKYKNGTRRD